MGVCKCVALQNIPGTADHHQIWLPKTHFIFKMIIVVLFLSPDIVSCEEYGYGSQSTDPVYEAICNITYVKPNTNISVSEKYKGRFGTGEENNVKVDKENGRVILVRTIENSDNGCKDFNMTIPTFKWVALMKRGDCPFNDKILKAKKNNASAVVIINYEEDSKEPHVMGHKVEGIVAVSLTYKDGEEIIGLIKSGINVTMYINVGGQIPTTGKDGKNPSKTSVVFVSVSFIVLMIISLAWLVFYYIQRFRYAHAKERLASRLASAAKKAIAKIPQKTVKNGDKEMSADFDQCAVCIEGYKAHDVIRTLPCKHVFHKSCVDPWLLDQRSCPMCKLDILRAYGMHVGGSEDSVHPDGESGNAISPVEDMEQTSVGDEQSADGEVKVLLLPQHVCLHHGGESSREGRSSIDSSHATCDPSEECTHSSDSECTELHSLMDHIGAAGGATCSVPVAPKDSDTEDLSV